MNLFKDNRVTRFQKTALFLFGLLCAMPLSMANAFQCQVSAGSLSFPSYNIFSTYPAESSVNILVSCRVPDQSPHSPLPVTIALSSGVSGNTAQRYMASTSGSDRLFYNLYTDSSFSSIWGDGTGSSGAVTNLVSINNPWNAVVYGRIPARQNVTSGSYSDIITVTIAW